DNVYGFDIEGTFEDAIYGNNVDHLNISLMRIDGKDDGQAGYGVDGIYILQDQSQDLHLYMYGDGIFYVQGDGLYVETLVNDGGTSHQFIDIINPTVEYAGEDGLDFAI